MWLVDKEEFLFYNILILEADTDWPIIWARPRTFFRCLKKECLEKNIT